MQTRAPAAFKVRAAAGVQQKENYCLLPDALSISPLALSIEDNCLLNEKENKITNSFLTGLFGFDLLLLLMLSDAIPLVLLLRVC